MWRCPAFVFLGVLLLANVSCDRTPTPPKAIVDAAKAEDAQTEPARPTTQELLSGTHRKLLLPDMPLSVRAPESWKFSLEGNLRLLEGPSPSGQAIIQLSVREPVRDDLVEGLVTRLKSEIDTSKPISKAELRQVGSMRVLERLSVSSPISGPKIDSLGNPVFDAQNNPVVMTTTKVQWTVIALIPEGKLWKRYELNVIALTTDNFDADRPLLEKVLGSLSHDTAPATQPI